MECYPELVALLDIKGLAPDMNLLTGGDPDVPVALGLVWVVRRVVGCLNGHLRKHRKIMDNP